jgi:hypothetical protein
MHRHEAEKIRLELLAVRAIRELILEEEKLLAEVLKLLHSHAATFVQITQVGAPLSTPSSPVSSVPNGTPIGGSSTFVAAFLQGQGGPAGTLQAGNIPQWSSTDSNVAITQSADGTQASVALGAGETAATYPLTVSAINSDGNPISNTISVNVLPAVVVPPPPPPDTAATFVQITQTA